MVCGLSLPFFLRSHSRRSKSISSSTRVGPISAPVGLDDQVRRLQFQRHHPDAIASDSGPFYLVANKNGPPRTIIRRTPIPPPTAPPLEDDYENITQAPTTMAQKANTDWAGRTRGGSLVTGASTMPVEDNFDTAMYAVPGGGDSNPDSAWPTPSNRIRDRVPPRVPVAPKERYFPAKASTNTPSPVSGSRTAHDTVEGYNDYNIYLQGMDRLNSEGDADVGAEKKLSEIGHVGHVGRAGHKQLGRIKSREVTRNSPITRSIVGPGHNVAYQTRFDTGARYAIDPSSRNRRKVPRPQQEYEAANRQVVEDTPEPTVAIATWREQVARETIPNDVETMSIHYMGLEDYAAAERTLTEVDSNVQSAQRTLHETARSDSMGSTRPADEPSKDAINPAVESEESSPASPIEPDPPRPPTPPQKSSSHLPPPRSLSSHSRHHSTPPRIATPDRVTLPKSNPRSPRASARRTMPVYPDPVPGPDPPTLLSPAHAPPHNFTFNAQPSSTPLGPSPSTFAAGIGTGSPLQESTPIRASMSPIPFRPRQSQGSTISSIKSDSVVQFGQLLDSCQPSLLHIAPVLARLGITKVEHLKAVARLSEEMRDREVREDALRMGVTVVEWAMLLDKVGMQ